MDLSFASPRLHAIRHWQDAPRRAALLRLRAARDLIGQSDRLDKEFPNLRASVAWLEGQADPESDRCLMATVDALADYLHARGLEGLCLHWCEAALRACERLGENPARVWLIQGEARQALGEWRGALDSFRQAMEASRAAAPSVHARAVLALGSLQFNRGDYGTAFRTLAEAERLLLVQGEVAGLAAVRAEQAAYHLNRGDPERALALYLDVERMQREAGAAETSDHLLLMLGVVHRKLGHHEWAEASLRALLGRGERTMQKAVQAVASHHLAWVELNRGRLGPARRWCGRAMALFSDLGDGRGLSDALEQQGMLDLAAGELDPALAALRRSLELRVELGNRHGAASCLRHLALVHLRRRDWQAAVATMWQSLSLYRRLGMLGRRRLAALARELVEWTTRRGRWTM